MPNVDFMTAPSGAAFKKPVKAVAKKLEGLVIHDLTEMKVARGVKTLIATAGRDEAIRECRRKVEKISRECRMDNVKYRDPHFDLTTGADFCLRGLRRPKAKETKSDGDNENGDDDNDDGNNDGDQAEAEASLPAKRVGDIYDDPKFIVDGIDAGDIKQGGAGDCWFLAAVATIANMPKLLESICVARDEQVGVYGFIFFRDGEWVSEVIDDQLFISHPNYAEASWDIRAAFATEKQYVEALQRGSGALHFAKCADSNETWLPLLEKAYAKAHGDYAAIEGGFTGEGVEDLTGGVTSEIITADILDRDRFWREELTKVNKELLFAGAIIGVDAFCVNGIITNHAYSVLQAIEANGKRFVQVRNPWGQSEWTGPWSDGSSEWTAEWMTVLKHKFGDDGAFWMSYEDFLNTFTSLDRTRVFTSDWTIAQAWTQCHVAWPASFVEQNFKITLTQSRLVVIVLQQADKRYFVGLDGQYDFYLHFRVRREGEAEYYARSKQNILLSRSVNKEVYLEAGTWVISFKVSRVKSGRPRLAEYIESFHEEQSEKYLSVARNYDYAYAKGLSEEQWEDIQEEIEEEPSAEPEDGNKKADEEQADEGAGEEEADEAEEDTSEDDTLAVIGVRVHAMDPKLQVELVPADEADTELDPDDSTVTSFLSSATDKSKFLSQSFRK